MSNLVLLAISAKTALIIMLVVLIVVALAFGAMLFMILSFSKKRQVAMSSKNVMYLLEKHEKDLVGEIEKGNHTEEKKTELMNKLRRAKSAQMLIEELVKEHDGAAPQQGTAPAPAKPTEAPKTTESKLVEPPAAKSASPEATPAAANASKPTANPAAKSTSPAENPAEKK